MMEDFLIDVKNLKTNFVTWKGVVKALDGVSFSIKKGETLGLVGETGCGKSVTSLSIMGLLPPTQGAIVGGKITFEGIDLTSKLAKSVKLIEKKGRRPKIRMSRRLHLKGQNFFNKIRGKDLSMIFQEPMTALNPVLSVGRQLTEPLLTHQREELLLRIISRVDVQKQDLEEIRDAMGKREVEKINKLMEDPLKNALVKQISSIYLRQDMTSLQKSEEIEKITKTKRPSRFVLNVYRQFLNGKGKVYWKLPLFKRRLMGPLFREARMIGIELLRSVNIYNPNNIIESYPHELSGGMRQRVMIAMALSCDPKLLIADEPTTALDVTTQAQILDLMKDLKRRTSASILFITHDLGVISDMADRIAVMYAGTVVEIGSKLDIFYEPKHPYTQGLLKSIPTEESMKTRLHIIPGSIPNLISPPSGCKFNPRCELAMDICREKNPDMRLVGKDHQAACWLYGGD